MGLINLQTDLKSLKFGKDKPGGGNSGQPFIQTPIPDNQSDPSPLLTNDTILRGGIQAPQRALTDVKRLTKYLFNPKSPSGLLFIAKENLLSRTSPKTEASKGLAYVGGTLNAGLYSPLNTLAQAGVGYLGTRLNQKGIDPTGLVPILSLNKYESVIKKQPLEDNRLINLFKENQIFSNNNSNVLEYGGGPGSTLGVGKTRIRFADQRTGANNLLAKSDDTNKKYFYKGGIKLHELDENSEINYTRYLGASNFQGLTLSENNITDSGKIENSPYKNIGGNPNNIIIKKSSDIDGFSTKGFGVFKGFREGGYGVEDKPDTLPGTYDKTNNINYLNFLGASNKYTFTPRASDDPFSPGPSEETITLNDNNINSNGKLIDNTFKEIGSNPIVSPDPDVVFNKSIQDVTPSPKDDSTYTFSTYKKDRLETLYKGNSSFTTGINIENRVNLGDPGTTKGSYTEPLDKVNGSFIYTSNEGYSGKDEGGVYNDLVSFRIGIIDPNNPSGELSYMNFRSYIDSFSDSYSADWKAQSYMGRGEKFYKYGGFDRSISMAFTVVAQSMGEMRGMYQKLNYLASSLAPTYTPQGYMAGNLCKMTVGDYIYEQYGFISSITYDVPQDSSWDLSLNPQNLEISRNDLNPDELPFMIKVTGLKFTPIHNFRPEIATNGTLNKGNKNQRYITNDLKLGS